MMYECMYVVGVHVCVHILTHVIWFSCYLVCFEHSFCIESYNKDVEHSSRTLLRRAACSHSTVSILPMLRS